MDVIQNKLNDFQKLVDEGMDATNTVLALKLIGIDGYDEDTIKSFKLWGDYMPMSDENPYTEAQRNLHILWEVL